MKSNSRLLRKLFFFYLSMIITIPLVAQKSKVDLQSLKVLKGIMIDWQSQSYKDVETETVYDAIKKLSKTSRFLMEIYNDGYGQYKSLLNNYNERKNNEPQLSYDVMTEVYKNTLRAKNRYLNKSITISGTITKISKNVYGESFFVIDPLIQCYFGDMNVNDIKKLTVTESVIIKGNVRLIDWYSNKPYMQLTSCEIVPEVNFEKWFLGIRNESEFFWNKYLACLDLEISKYEPKNDVKNESEESYSDSWSGIYVSPIGVLKIVNEAQDKFEFSIDVSQGHYSGSIDGSAQIISQKKAVYKDNCDEGGDVIFSRMNNQIKIEESGCITFLYHGAGTNFNSVYKKFTK